MPQPTITQVHIDRAVSNILVAFLQKQEAFLSNVLFPRVPVPNKSNLYFVFDRAYWLANRTRKRAAGAEAPRGAYNITTQTYTTERDAFGFAIADPIRSNADAPLDLDRQATELVGQQMLLAQEVDFQSKYFTTGKWTGSSTGSDITPAVTWDDPSSTPVEDVRKQMRYVQSQTGFRPNCFALGRATFDRLCDHPDIIDRIKHAAQTNNTPATANEQTLAAIWGLDRIVVANAVQNTAAEGKAASYGFINGTGNALLVYAAPAPGLMVPSAGYKFVWTANGGAGTPNASGIELKRYREEKLESDIIEAGIWYQHNLVAASLGVYFSNAIASAAQ